MYCKYCEYFVKILYPTVLRGHCRNDKIKYIEPDNVDIDGIAYMDSDNYGAEIVFGGRFGCIHFKEKNNNI